MPCYSPLKGYEARTGGFTTRKADSHGNKMTVACGGCLGCRLDRSQMWAARIVHEAMFHDENCFVTLTYDKENLPWPPSLDVRHFQNFMKKVRNEFPNKRIRYFHCGEYGESVGKRPHYHACLFGVDFTDTTFFDEREGIFTYTSEKLEHLWGKGFCTVGELNEATAAYTARYVLKKVGGVLADDHYTWIDMYGVARELSPEYCTMSRGGNSKTANLGGIGSRFYKQYRDDMFPSDEVPIPGKGVMKKVPRFYTDLLKADAETKEEAKRLLEEVEKDRNDFMRSNQEEYSPERLYAKYKVKKRSLEFLKRSL